MKITKVGGKTCIDISNWGRFEIWTLRRGPLRRSKTFIEHTGQLDWEVAAFAWIWGRSHRRAADLLRRQVLEWEHSGQPPMRNATPNRRPGDAQRTTDTGPL